MEWVEITGKNLAEVTEQALDQLGVAADDAEIVVVSEPRIGLFGRSRGEARVRARVRPVGPPPRRNRRGKDQSRSSSTAGRSSSGGRGSSANGGNGASRVNGRNNGRDEVEKDAQNGKGSSARRESSAKRGSSAKKSTSKAKGANSKARASQQDGETTSVSVKKEAGRGTRGSKKVNGSNNAGNSRRSRNSDEEVGVTESISLEEQALIARDFITGLIETLGLDAVVDSREIDEETIEIFVVGDDLGLLVGPRGSTLSSLQDLTRAVVQRHFTSRTNRILVDVAGYREKRVVALQRFSRQIAQEVIESGNEHALEPMSPADRKVIHDTINSIDRVVTRSQGQDTKRYVVIARED